jgi:hypothetical protein
MYNQYNKNKMDGLLIRPKLEQGLQFFVPIGTIFVELEDCPDTRESHEGELALVVVLQ